MCSNLTFSSLVREGWCDCNCLQFLSGKKYDTSLWLVYFIFIIITFSCRWELTIVLAGQKLTELKMSLPPQRWINLPASESFLKLEISNFHLSIWVCSD